MPKSVVHQTKQANDKQTCNILCNILVTHNYSLKRRLPRPSDSHRSYCFLLYVIVHSTVLTSAASDNIQKEAELPATNRLPRWRIGERPSDMGVSCELSGHLLSDEQAVADLQRQCHHSVEVVVGWRCLLPLRAGFSITT